MSDLAIQHDGCRFDWVISGISFGESDSLYESVVNSIFCDRRADPSDEIPDGGDDPRGWWADTQSGEGKIGSRLWTLRRAKATDATRLIAIGMIRDSLEWLVSDEIAERFEVEAAYTSIGRLEIGVTIYRRTEEPQQFQFLWGGT